MICNAGYFFFFKNPLRVAVAVILFVKILVNKTVIPSDCAAMDHLFDRVSLKRLRAYPTVERDINYYERITDDGVIEGGYIKSLSKLMVHKKYSSLPHIQTQINDKKLLIIEKI